jgi:hypothetical protein
VTETLYIERLATRYRVPRDHPSALRLGAEMDDIARSYITDGCSRAIGACIDPDDPSIWVIDEVRLNLLVDIRCAPAPDIAHLWGKRIVAAVARVMAAGPDGAHVLRFANRAAYLAHFLRNLAEDRAWDKWYFAEFAALRSLPRNAALREALLREPQTAEAALLELDRTHTLGPVVAALTRADQEQVIECCANGAAYSAAALAAALRMSHAALWSPAPLLSLYLRIRTECPGMAPSSAVGAADHLERVLNWRQRGELRRIVRAMTQGNPTPLTLTPEELETARMLRIIAVTGGADLVGSVIGAGESGTTGSRQRESEFETEFGSVFLLAAVLAETPALLRVIEGEAGALRRCLLYGLCLTAGGAVAWQDMALRVAADADAVPDPADLAALDISAIPGALHDLAMAEDVSFFARKLDLLFAQKPLSPATGRSIAVCAAVLVREFARRLPALSASSVWYLWANILAGPGRVLVTDDVIEIRLAPRPLQIVLRMAGLHERVIDLPGCPGKAFVVRFEES